MADSNIAVTENGTSDGVPDVALRWILLHATTSNVELAHLSNVCRSWRKAVTTVVLEQATYKTASGEGQHQQQQPLLLLPSMVSQLIRMNNYSSSSNNNSEDATTPSNVPKISTDETFCAAWFAPEGVQLLDLDGEQVVSEDEHNNDSSSSSSSEENNTMASSAAMHRHCRHPSSSGTKPSSNKNLPNNKTGGTNKASPKMNMNSMLQRRPPNLEQIPQGWSRGFGGRQQQHRMVSFQERGIVVSHEWQGYRQAMQILYPFGYANKFVQQVLQQGQLLQNSTESSLQLDDDESLKDKNSNNPVSSTIAVRGATIARPEGYCLCWELPTPDSLQQVVKWTRSNSKNNNNEDMVQTIKLQERQRKLRQWKEWRRQLQLTVLPQVLARSPPFADACVQFLNSDEKHAVRFMTPQFDCGPIGEPVTILVVGIATEDGCFCSGLHNRFELGHLYPNSALMELSEMSPICMAVDTISAPTVAADGAVASGQTTSSTPQTPVKTPLEQHLLSDDDSEDDSDDDYGDDSSSELAGSPSHPNPTKKRGWLNNCTCIFQDKSDPMGFASTKGDENRQNTASSPGGIREDSQTMRLDDDDSDDDPEAERILRGSRIPGMWHCYAAVFDGKQYSTLRVDGVEEVLVCDSQGTPNTGIGGSNDADNSHAKGTSGPSSSRNHRTRGGPRAMLDGLTIGSDHCFDMTLCFGQGSGGEGEGAIAEIAVFSGRLDLQDLEVLEKQLMVKHGIPNPDLSREALVKEDEWTRKSTALYCQTPAESAAYHLRHRDDAALGLEQNTVPLRIMTKHRSVAWHQFNPVTGEELRIKRIGSRSAGSSSDW